MSELILNYKVKGEENHSLTDKFEVKEKLLEADWDNLTSIHLIYNKHNMLYIQLLNGSGNYNLTLNDKIYEDETTYSNKSEIINSFQTFLLEKNRFKLSKPFKEIETKKAYRFRDEDDEYDFSYKGQDAAPAQSYTPEPAAPRQQTAQRQRPSQKKTESDFSWRSLWWVIALLFFFVKSCLR